MSALAPPQWHDCSFSRIAQYWGFPPPAALCEDGDGSAMPLTPSSILSIYPFTCPKLPCKLKDVAPFSVGCFFSHGVGPAAPESVKTLKNFLA